MSERYAKFWDLTFLYPDWDLNGFIKGDDSDEYYQEVRDYLREHPGQFRDGDILFIGSTYETRQEYGFATVINNGTNFEGGEYPKMTTPGVYYREAMDSIDEFWRGLEGFGYFDNDRDLWIQELKESGNYEKPEYKEIWKSLLPGTKKLNKKMNKNRVFINETLGLPNDVADKISRLTVFGRRKVCSEMEYLKKFI
jgi:hypothetical protein